MAGIHHKGVGSDAHHKGPGNASNKSLLSYRSDIGVPGYTGVIPANGGVLVPSKDANLRTGKALDPVLRETARTGLVQDGTLASTYTSTLRAKPGAFRPTDKTGGGYWIKGVGTGAGHGEQVSYWTGEALVGSASRPFIATTTYQAEVLRGANHAAGATGRTQDVRPTLSHYKAGHTLKNGGLNALESTTGYVSNYTAMVVKDPKVGGVHAAGHDLSMTAPATFDRYKVERKGLKPRFDSGTLYAQSYGEYGSDPLAIAAGSAADMTATATTRTLNLGTTRGGVKHIPGYAGFMERSGHNPRAVEHSGGEVLREDAKTNAQFYSALDQYSRGMVPGYVGYRTQDPKNFQLPQAPTSLTTTGKQNFECNRKPHELPDNANFRSGKDGSMSFFQGGTLTVSENGKANAERFYGMLRPHEGLPRIHYPSKTTNSGYYFPN